MAIQFEAKILPCDLPAQSGDIIPRSVLMDYVDSKQCKERLEKGLITGGMSHMSRRTDIEGIPAADQILVDGNMFYKAIELWVEENFLMARFKVFEDLVLPGKMQVAYNTFITMLKNDMKPPVSSALRAYWDNNICKEIVFLRGVDVTLQPGFQGSEITKIMID